MQEINYISSNRLNDKEFILNLNLLRQLISIGLKAVFIFEALRDFAF